MNFKDLLPNTRVVHTVYGKGVVASSRCTGAHVMYHDVTVQYDRVPGNYFNNLVGHTSADPNFPDLSPYLDHEERAKAAETALKVAEARLSDAETRAAAAENFRLKAASIIGSPGYTDEFLLEQIKGAFDPEHVRGLSYMKSQVAEAEKATDNIRGERDSLKASVAALHGDISELYVQQAAFQKERHALKAQLVIAEQQRDALNGMCKLTKWAPAAWTGQTGCEQTIEALREDISKLYTERDDARKARDAALQRESVMYQDLHAMAEKRRVAQEGGRKFNRELADAMGLLHSTPRPQILSAVCRMAYDFSIVRYQGATTANRARELAEAARDAAREELSKLRTSINNALLAAGGTVVNVPTGTVSVSYEVK